MCATTLRAAAVRATTLLALIGATAPLASQEPALPGQLREHVRSPSDTTHPFAVYMPSKRQGPRAPLLIVLDPSGGAVQMLREFAPAAEQLGWVVASAEDSRSDNGDETPTVESAAAIIAWATKAFPLDGRRVYLTGMSGTARIAWLIWRDYRSLVAGVLCAGATVAAPGTEEFVQGDPTVAVALTAGNTDFNYAEVRTFAPVLEKQGIAHRFGSFAGPHAWPPREELAASLNWLELRAMLGGRRPVDSAFVHAAFARDLARADSLAAAGDLDMAEVAARTVERDAVGWPEAAEAHARVTTLGARAEFVTFRKTLDATLARENAQQGELLKVLAWEEARMNPPSVDDLLDRLGAPALVKDTKGSDVQRALSAKRQIARLRGMLGFYAPALRERAGKPEHAARLREAGQRLKAMTG